CDKSEPHCLQKLGIWSVCLSGVSTILSVCPSWPGCPPCLRLVFSRRLWFLRAKSTDGGRWLLLLFLPTFDCSNCLFNAPDSCFKSLFSFLNASLSFLSTSFIASKALALEVRF